MSHVPTSGEVSTLPKGFRGKRAFRPVDRLLSVVYAARGLSTLLREEHNARLHLCASLLIMAAGLILNASPADWRWLVSAAATVWLAEAFNTAIERLCDRLCPQFDPAIGGVKDMAAGGVLIAAIGAGLIGLLTLGPLLLKAVA